jgi:serine/threonine protein kinase
MAPEQATSSSVGAAADIFSFGLIAAELLFGAYPFAEPPARTVTRGDAWPALILADAARVPAALELLIRECLARDPEERPSAAQVVARLEGVARSAGAA